MCVCVCVEISATLATIKRHTPKKEESAGRQVGKRKRLRFRTTCRRGCMKAFLEITQEKCIYGGGDGRGGRRDARGDNAEREDGRQG